MKAVSTCGVCFALALAAAQSRADEPGDAPPRRLPAAVTASAQQVPGVTLGRPAALPGGPRQTIAESTVQSAVYRPPAIAVGSPVTRAQMAEAPTPLPRSFAPTAEDLARAAPPLDPVQPLRPAPLALPPENLPLVAPPQRSIFAVERAAQTPDVVPIGLLLRDDTPAVGQPEYVEGPAAPPSRFYVRGEYLVWWSRETSLPPLVTTGPVGFLPLPPAPPPPLPPGAIGRPDTVVLFGNASADYPAQSGARFTVGWVPDPCYPLGLEASVFFLGPESFNFNASSPALPVITRPFFNQFFNQQDVQTTAFPGVAIGTASVNSSTRLWGAEANLRPKLCCGCGYQVDLLIGPRFLDLSEDLAVAEQIVSLVTLPGTNIGPGSRIVVFDRFGTRNQFIGGQVGAVVELTRGPWALELRGKVALGDTHQIIDVIGGQIVTQPAGVMGGANPVLFFPGGLLALPSNIGRFTTDRLSVVPELTVNVGYNFTDRLRVFAGYNFLYWSNVVRPADQIDLVLDPAQIPNFPNPFTGQPFPSSGGRRPLVPFRQTDYWAQGLTFGIELRY
jgi:hypothetical protein